MNDGDRCDIVGALCVSWSVTPMHMPDLSWLQLVIGGGTSAFVDLQSSGDADKTLIYDRCEPSAPGYIRIA